MFWVISVYFNIRNTLLKSGTFLLGHPVYDPLPITPAVLIASFNIIKSIIHVSVTNSHHFSQPKVWPVAHEIGGEVYGNLLCFSY